jgi:hypothetical protein
VEAVVVAWCWGAAANGVLTECTADDSLDGAALECRDEAAVERAVWGCRRTEAEEVERGGGEAEEVERGGGDADGGAG